MSESFVGRTLGRYRVLERLGAGGMGEVYRAHDTHLKRDVAIKLLPGNTAEAARRQMRREAHALSTLNHPNIATIHDLVEEDGVSFVVMEHIKGQSLASWLLPGPLAPEQALDIARQVGAGLQEAHQHGIVHRDLKPGNIMLTAGQVKLVDFGIASRMASSEAVTATLTDVGATAGTLPYMAPEQVAGEAADVRSDIWAFGVVLYEMLTGRRPFTDENPLRLAQRILNKEPERPTTIVASVPARLEHTVLRALQKDPERRFQTAAEMVLALESDATIPEPVRPHPPAQPPTTAGWGPAAAPLTGAARPRRWLVPIAVATALAIAGGVAGWRLRQRPAEPETRLSVIVGDAVNRTGEAAFDDTVNELLTTSLNQSRFLSVYPRSRVASVLRLMQRDPSTPIDDAVGLEICQREGVGALVSTSISRLGTSYVLLITMTEPTGQVLATARETFASPADTPARIDAAVLSLRSDVGESSSSIRASSAPLADVSSASLEAVRFYTLGLRRQRAGDPEQAMVLYEKALEVDPEFAMAQDALGVAYTNLQDLARAEEHLAKAAALVDKVPEAERHKILADYNLLRRDYRVACDHLQVLTELRPLDPFSFQALGICKGFSLDFADAVVQTQRGLEMQSSPIGRVNLARWQLGNGQAADALAGADAVRQEQPTNLQAQFVAGRAELALGRLDDARRTYEAMVAQGDDAEAEGRLGLADLALGTGHVDTAREELEAAWQTANRRRIALAAGRAAVARAELAIAAAEPAEFDRAMARLQEVSNPVLLYLRARCFARAGRAAEAAAGEAALAAATGDSAPDEAMRAMLRAELALARGDAAAAMREANAAYGFEPSVLARETQARAHAAAGRAADAIRFFEDELARHTQRLDSYDAPGFHRLMDVKYRLGVLLDDAGESARATPYLEAVVNAWAGAPADAARLVDARRRLSTKP